MPIYFSWFITALLFGKWWSQTITTYRKVGAFYIACNHEFSPTRLIRTSQDDLLPNSSRAARPYNFPQPLRWLVPCRFPSCVIQGSLRFLRAGSDPE